MMNFNKKVVLINGTVQLPLKLGSRATVYQHGETIRTSTVAAIKQVGEDFIVFETQNSTYCVTPSFAPEPSPMAVCLAGAVA